MRPRLIARLASTGLAVSLVVAPAVARAETPVATPSATASATPGPSAARTPASESPVSEAPTASTPRRTSPTPGSDLPPATPTLTATPVPTSSRTPGAAAEDAGRGSEQQATGPASLTLSVSAGGTPQPGRFFEDIGHYAIRGVLSGRPAGTRVNVYWYSATQKQWRRSGSVAMSGTGGYAFDQPVGSVGTFRFRTTVGGAPGTTGVVSSNEVRVSVLNAYVKQDKPVASIDSLKNPTVSGTVYPARRGVRVQLQVLRADKVFRTSVTAATDAAGRYRAVLGYGNSRLATYSVRSAYPATNRRVWERSATHKIKRVKKLNAVITRTTAAEVAKTYRAGCPVGRSKLSTIRMNYYGFDKRMHRGMLIVRSTLTGKITRGFSKAMTAGYPIAKMRNPNDYGGNDPRQMEANNTSGFNCRKVVGNPYAQSPHSYGIAIDVNTVQNPYRDRNGKWWPKNGRKYIDRTPRRTGMLTRGSTLTRQLKRDGYFWGGLWNPGRDYQHYEYDR